MSKDFVRSVLREHCEATMPKGKDPWHAIKERVQSSDLEYRAAPSSVTIISGSAEPKSTPTRHARGMISHSGGGRFRVSMAMLLIALSAFTATLIAFVVGIAPQLGSFAHRGDNASIQQCWDLESSSNVEGRNTVLSSVSASAANDVWAVGYSSSSGITQTLAQHWNGSGWSVVPSANIPSRINYLTGVAALASNDVWAVGYHCIGDCADESPLIQHWNGAQWSIVSSPGNGRLNGMAAVSGDDIWAVGNGERQSIALHWDGQRWIQVPTNDPPLASSSIILNAVAAVSSQDVWAVGYEHDPIAKNIRSVIYHWDGRGWSNISETGGPTGDSLTAVDSLSANDIWAVGQRGTGQYNEEPLRTVTKHWDGERWLEVSSPNVGGGDSYLRGVAAISPTDAWAVGGYGPRAGTKQTFVLHWDGLAWSVVPSPNVEGNSNRFLGIEAISANDIWSVGNYNNHNGTSIGALVERYNNPCKQLILPRRSR